MAYGRKTRRTTRRKPTYKRRYWRRRIRRYPIASYVRTPNSTGAFPNQMITSVKVCNAAPYDFEPVGQSGTISFKLNSFLDPMGDFGAEIPKDFGELSNIYRSYYIYGGNIKLSIINTCNAPVVFSWFISTSSNAGTTVQNAIMSGKSLMLTPPTGSRAMVVMRKKFRVKDYYDVKRNYEDLHYTGLGLNGDPSEILYLHVHARTLDGATNLVMQVLAEFNQKVILSELYRADLN